MDYVLIAISSIFIILIVFIYIKLNRDTKIKNILKKDIKLSILLFILLVMSLISLFSNIFVNNK